MTTTSPNHQEEPDKSFPDLESSQNSNDGYIPGHKRSLSGSILSKLSFLRASADTNHGTIDNGPVSPELTPGDDQMTPKKASRAMAVVQQQRTRKRKGSLRKAALLGRGAQREKRESKATSTDPDRHFGFDQEESLEPSPTEVSSETFGLGIVEAAPKTPSESYISRASNSILHPINTLSMGHDDHNTTSPTILSATSPTLTYTSTTDEDDVLSMSPHPSLLRPTPGSHFPMTAASLTRRRSSQKPASPLSLSGLATTPLPDPDADWDYSETEWWGWVILTITWLIFVTGMGSCLGVWSWAWDVGETPYAPPELEDDPTLPIVGYYPALIILTAVMAWVWVVVAWVGMKYFRHAKISGD